MTRSAVLLGLVVLFITVSCKRSEDDPGSGRLVLSINQKTANTGGRKGSIAHVEKLFVSIQTSDGVAVFTKHELRVTGEAKSEPLAISPGAYLITELIATDKDNQVLFATPKSGSELARFVTTPLSLPINLLADQEIDHPADVVSVFNRTANQFGYSSFF